MKSFESSLLWLSAALALLQVAISQDCSSDSANFDYMGSKSRTETNETCLYWRDAADVYLWNTLDNELIDGLEDAQNFCRNPKGEHSKKRAGCFVDLANRRWEYCSIPKCQGCSQVHGIKHASIQIGNRRLFDDESYRPGTTFKFKCNANYTDVDPYSGPLTWQCLENGQWSSTKLPKCLWRGLIVPDVPPPECWYYSSNLFYPSDNKPRILFYGRKNVNKDGIRCLNWLQASQYRNSDFPEEGIINALNFCRSPDDFEPRCFSNNYQSLASCDVPKCIGCPAIPYVKYATFNIKYDTINDQNAVNEGSVLTYKCLVGRLVGSDTLVCQNGQWITSNFPKCQINYCATPPPQPLNSYNSYKKLVYANMADYGKAYLAHGGSIMIFQCLTSYQFSDPAVDQVSYECVDGIWTLNGRFSDCVARGPTTTPSVGAKYCPKPRDVENGYLQTGSLVKIDNYDYDGAYTVQCFSGYTLVGPATVQCVAGAWTNAPTCSKKASCSLNVISEPAINVRILDTNLMYDDMGTGIAVGSFVNYECLDGFEPEFSSQDLHLRCLPNGKWSARIPVRCVSASSKRVI